MADIVLVISRNVFMVSAVILIGGIVALAITGRLEIIPRGMKRVLAFFAVTLVVSFVGVIVSIQYL